MDPPTTAGKHKRPAAAAAAAAVSDADVEEFYAILRRHRRMLDASRRPVSGAGAQAGPQTPTHVPAPWRPSFSMADFAQPAPTPAAVPALRQHQLPVAGNATPPRRPASIALDLNAEPEPQEPPTPRPERDQA
ncbi:hypothetical protein QYE76_070321 [Lolium multiflorum]|uniref:Uncharacterized protein n=1 Tax=Lolium multiflorum TaxID=4521 RepID=A0AAD8WDI8_LOLMU|nr:hypothetical protein QYE76_070321 [Lolium multiflorum]